MGIRTTYFKTHALIGLIPLILRWPVMCFKKVPFACLNVADIQYMQGAAAQFRPVLAMYLVRKLFMEADTGHKSVVCVPCRDISFTYDEYLQASPYLYFKLSDVEEAEQAYPDFLENEQGHDSRLVCSHENIKQMLQLTLYELSRIDSQEKGFAAGLKFVLSGSLASDYWNPAQYADKELPIPPGGWRDPDDLTITPQLPDAKARPQIEHNFEAIKEYIISRCQRGVSDPQILVHELDELYPGLTDTNIGQLLPAEFFPGRGNKPQYSMELYERKDDTNLETLRKRGRRLRGKR